MSAALVSTACFYPGGVLSNTVKISIELLPEFGWSCKGQHVFGPGSVFQGFVRVSVNKVGIINASCIRLLFQASDGIPARELGPGLLRNAKKTVLFGIQKILWNQGILDKSSYSFPFIIQLPMMQYPPSIETPDYQCTFRLTARLEDHDANTYMFVQRKIIYVPFLETTLAKAPPFLQQQQDRQLSLKIAKLDYVPGDTIQLTLDAPPSDHIVIAKVVRIITFLADNSRDETIACQERQGSSHTDTTIMINFDLPSAPDLVPSFSYGIHVSISYQLQVTVEHQKKRISTLLSSSAAKFRVPIRIGTLGLGVRAPDSLVYYSTIANIQEYTPKFVDTIENENYLPPYDSSRLPEYNTNDPAGPSSTFLA
ncbi:hypothetical protein VTP01DRAFT_2262 [Rhizomucor pusillus]|uniref:uncharacterized protein n=1 Tax=Rhizomucor pusillus TaxID=4840 RepID=UPI003742A33D